MGAIRWEGKHLSNLIHLTINELLDIYPNYSIGTLNGKKSYWRNKITKGEIPMPPKPEQEPKGFDDILRLHHLNPETLKEFADQGFHVGYIKNKEGEIEYTLPLPRARKGNKNLDDFTPAVAAKITPSRRKPAKREHKRLYVFSDAQIDYRRLEDGTLEPIHDETALEIGRMICKDIMPDEIINLGDTVDLAALSRFKPDSDHFHRTLGASFQRVHDYYSELRADNPWAKIVEVDSNHNTRLKDFMLKNAPDMYGMKQAGAEADDYPVFTYPFLANLKAVQVDWVSGYGAAEYVYGLEYDTPPIVFKHGKSAVSNGSTAAKESKENPETHVVRGHSHRIETAYRTTRAGHYLASVVVGASCRTTGEVPSYHSAVDDRGQVVSFQENWQMGVMVIEDYNGTYHFNHIPINNGEAFYNGKHYSLD
jgi:hypothetical protein